MTNCKYCGCECEPYKTFHVVGGETVCEDCYYIAVRDMRSRVQYALSSIPDFHNTLEEEAFVEAFREYMSEIRNVKVPASGWDFNRE